MIQASGNNMTQELRAGAYEIVAELYKQFGEELAKNGRYGHGAFILMPEDGGYPLAAFAGDRDLETRTEYTLRVVADSLRDNMINRIPPAPCITLDASHVMYNMPAGSLCYDFLTWLIDAELHRIMAGAPAPLKVHFWYGRDGSYQMQFAALKQMFDNVIRPSLKLVGAIEHKDAEHGRYYPNRHLIEVTRAAQRGVKIPKFKAPDSYISEMRALLGDGKPPVTITLRESPHWPHRNSRSYDWLRFAQEIRSRGERVIFVRDTAKADDIIDSCETCPIASKDILARAALYELAKANLFVANGPCELAKFSDRPYLIFIHVEPDGSAYKANTPKFVREGIGIEVGDQLPWSAPNQRLIWLDDTYNNISTAWRALETILEPNILEPINRHGQYVE